MRRVGAGARGSEAVETLLAGRPLDGAGRREWHGGGWTGTWLEGWSLEGAGRYEEHGGGLFDTLGGNMFGVLRGNLFSVLCGNRFSSDMARAAGDLWVGGVWFWDASR